VGVQVEAGHATTIAQRGGLPRPVPIR
jgi:hypothetical protein